MIRLVPAILVYCIAVTGCGTEQAVSSGQETREQPEAPTCDIPRTGPVSIKQLPEGSSVLECDAVGRTVVWRDMGVVVPSPGAGLDMHVSWIDPAKAHASFGIFVSKSGSVSYHFPPPP